MMNYHLFIILIDVADVIRLHDDVIARFGGMPGLRDRGLLESAVQHPLDVIEYGQEEEHEIHYLAAIYFFHIIKNHAFYDGNKRTGLLTTLTFLSRNGCVLDVDGDELYDLALETARSSRSVQEIAHFFKSTIKKL